MSVHHPTEKFSEIQWILLPFRRPLSTRGVNSNHGPAIPSVYDLYKRYGGKSIPQAQPFVESLVSPDILDILEQVWSVYGSFTGNQLEELTHRETPWLKARANLPAYAASSEVISDKEIYKYYCIQALS